MCVLCFVFFVCVLVFGLCFGCRYGVVGWDWVGGWWGVLYDFVIVVFILGCVG